MFSYPKATYEAKPFPHAVVKGAWDVAALLRCKHEIAANQEWSGEKAFYGAKGKRWLSDPNRMPPEAAGIIEVANSPKFLRWLEALTGETGLVADYELTGGGIHSILPGGFLGLHADFNVLPGRALYRRLNVLLYLNPEWQAEWGGDLVLQGDGEKRVQPNLGTMVVFTTDDDSIHGHPDPLRCPDGVTRDSIALYYYSREQPARGFAAPRTNTDYGLRLNLGCGDRHLPGFTNVDLANNWCKRPPDLSHDITQPLPFDDASAEEVHAYHVVEHFYRFEIDAILDDWVRVIRPGGKLVLECPCLDKILHIFRVCADKGLELPDNLTMWGLYGDPNHFAASMCHRWCYSVGELTSMLRDRGLVVSEETPQTHQPVRDMRLVGVKQP